MSVSWLKPIDPDKFTEAARLAFEGGVHCVVFELLGEDAKGPLGYTLVVSRQQFSLVIRAKLDNAELPERPPAHRATVGWPY